MHKMDEKIAVFPAYLIAHYSKSGYYKYHSSLMNALLRRVTFQRRGDMEDDPTWRQLIPYVYVYNKEGALLTYRRAQGEEQRLKAKVSIGFGGHINQEDDTGDYAQLVQTAGYRELLEELTFVPAFTHQLVPAGFIVGHETPVDKVHFGVALALAYSGKVSAHDNECEILGWKKRAELLREPNIENWTKKLLLEFGK